MAGLDYTPSIAISAEFDARTWSGVTVFTRGVATGMNTFAAGEGLYDDVLEFLHGMGSQSAVSLQDDFTANGTGAGAWTVGLNTSDRFWVSNDTENWALTGSAANLLLGWPSAGFANNVLAGPPYIYTGTSEWVRGLAAMSIELDPTPTGLAFTIPSQPSYAQNLMVLLREVNSTGDADDSHGTGTTQCLESLDNTANDNVKRTIRWGITAAGHVYTARTTGEASAISTWDSTTFRDRLGFTGAEAEATVGGYEILTAANPLPGFIVPSRPVENLRRWSDEKTNVVERSDGDMHSNNLVTTNGWNLEFWVGGPADTTDHSRHFLDYVMPYIPLGSRVTVYQEWGDSRRAINSRSGNDYTVLQTPEFNGRRGRLRCRRSGNDSPQKTANWRNRVEQAFLVSLSLHDVSD